jgi:hypothetical protein
MAGKVQIKKVKVVRTPNGNSSWSAPYVGTDTVFEVQAYGRSGHYQVVENGVAVNKLLVKSCCEIVS